MLRQVKQAMGDKILAILLTSKAKRIEHSLEATCLENDTFETKCQNTLEYYVERDNLIQAKVNVDRLETEMYLVYPGFFYNERALQKALECEREHL